MVRLGKTVRETWIERLMRRALDEGDVTNLPGAGKPIADLDEPYDPLWWGKKLMKREKLSVVPSALEMRRKVERCLAEVEKLGDENEVRRKLERLNAEIARSNATTAYGPATSVAVVDIEDFVERWRRCKPSPPLKRS